MQYIWIFTHFILASHISLSLFAWHASWSTICKRNVFLQLREKSNQASTKYSPDVFNSFYWTITHGEFHKIFTSRPPPNLPPSLKRGLPLFHCRNVSFCCFPIFFIKIFQAPLKRYSVSTDLWKPPLMLFFCFRQNTKFPF